MNLQVVFCTYQTAPLKVRERIAFSSEDQMQDAYTLLERVFPNSEAVLLSTCNRVELYAAQEDAAEDVTTNQLVQFFSDFHGVPVKDFEADLRGQSGQDAVQHLFQVTSSIDSMVLGEPQIVSQVKDAYRIAVENDACGPLTNALFQRAINVSGRVRNETRLAAGRVSIASVAVGEFGKGIFDSFDKKTVLVIGAGEMAEETLRYLREEGVTQVMVVNRSLERAEQLAERWRGSAHRFEDLDELMRRADVIVSTTGSDRPIVDAKRFKAVRKNTERHPVFILDLAAPRDFAPDVGRVDDNVFLFDIDHLEKTCDRNRKAREKEIRRARTIIDDETQKFMQEFYHRATGPVVQLLREQWHQISRDEMDRMFKKLGDLSEADRVTIKRSVERIVNKLLHPPLVTLKDEAKEGTPHGLVDALKRLFHLSE